MLVIGVDEAGYGPLLGPLVVAGTAFRVEGDGAEGAAEFAPSLTGALDEVDAELDGRLRVGDSKEVHRRGGLAALERTVLAFLAAASGEAFGSGLAPRLDDVLGAVSVDPAERREVPWYAEDPPRFPVHHRWPELARTGDALRGALGDHGVRVEAMAADVVPEPRLNRRFRSSQNKADTLFETSASVLGRLLALRRPGEPVHVVMDRQGGRKRYLPKLQERWPGSFVWTLDESARCSRYSLDLEGAPVTIRFLVEGDRHEPQVGLASMTAKYLREVFMGLLNGWFDRICPGVAPTAGYTQDGRRWLDETRPARTAAGIPDRDLVRIR